MPHQPFAWCWVSRPSSWAPWLLLLVHTGTSVQLFVVFLMVPGELMCSVRLELHQLRIADPIRAGPGGGHPPHCSAVPRALLRLHHWHRSGGGRCHVLHGLGSALLCIAVLLKYLQEHFQEAGEDDGEDIFTMHRWRVNTSVWR